VKLKEKTADKKDETVCDQWPGSRFQRIEKNKISGTS
jgi:hypothetical protein